MFPYPFPQLVDVLSKATMHKGKLQTSGFVDSFSWEPILPLSRVCGGVSPINPFSFLMVGEWFQPTIITVLSVSIMRPCKSIVGSTTGTLKSTVDTIPELEMEREEESQRGLPAPPLIRRSTIKWVALTFL